MINILLRNNLYCEKLYTNKFDLTNESGQAAVQLRNPVETPAHQNPILRTSYADLLKKSQL